MMEGSHDDGNSLVRVRAQVMTRDDSTGGWVPLGGGGLSHVSVCKGSSEDGKLEYLIYGKRIADQTVVLSCTIKKDFQYNKVMPTFHHWKTGDKKYGLTFQTAADARAFDKGVRMAIEDLSDGTGDFPNFYDSELDNEDVFMTLELPADSRSSSASSSFSGGSFRPDPYSTHLHRLSFIRSPRFQVNPSSNNNVVIGGGGGGYVPDPTVRSEAWSHGNKKHHHHLAPDNTGDPDHLNNSYVQLSRGDGKQQQLHDYSYPIMDSNSGSYKGGGGAALKKPHHPHLDSFACSQPPPRLPVKAKKESRWRRRPPAGGGSSHLTLGRARCRHCLEVYSLEDNRPGACEYAPDAVLRCIDCASCVHCASCVLYHCTADSEGDFVEHPCSCDSAAAGCPKRWTILALLSLFVPCLWCYPPCRSCHWCGVRCGVCGGRHDPA